MDENDNRNEQETKNEDRNEKNAQAPASDDKTAYKLICALGYVPCGLLFFLPADRLFQRRICKIPCESGACFISHGRDRRGGARRFERDPVFICSDVRSNFGVWRLELGFMYPRHLKCRSRRKESFTRHSKINLLK